MSEYNRRFRPPVPPEPPSDLLESDASQEKGSSALAGLLSLFGLAFIAPLIIRALYEVAEFSWNIL